MRRLFGALLLCSSLALIGATTPSPSPASPPAPASPVSIPTFVPTVGGPPAVIVYPFDVTNGVNSTIGIAIAQILSQQMAAAGGLNVLDVPVGVTRANFLSNAAASHADYYLSGYVTPVGDSAAVVEQLVSVSSGIILFSQTAQVSSVSDVASQGLLARSIIMARSNPQSQDLGSEAKATPAPSSTDGAAVKIPGLGGIVDSVFHHGGKGEPTPSPTPVVKPSRGVLVVKVSGTPDISAAELTNGTALFYAQLEHYYSAQMTAATGDIGKQADAICGSDRNNTIATGTLSVDHPKHGKQTTTFALSIYTCFGAVLYQGTAQGPNAKAAIAAAIADYAAAHPDNS